MPFATKTLVAALLLASGLSAGPINVSYTVTGSPGDWTLDFSVNNNLTGYPNQDMYFFGVLLDDQDITGFPAVAGSAAYALYCNPTCGSPSTSSIYNPSVSDGPNLNYNNVWIESGPFTNDTALFPGSTLSGFDVLDTADLTAPTSVSWFAFTVDDRFPDGTNYTGGDNFNSGISGAGQFPGFAGTATSASPEPSTLILLSSAFLALAGFKRKVR